MAKYFNYFPKTLYTANNSSAGLDTVTNIIARFGFEQSLKNNSSAFYKYQIQESDTPEIIAHKYYGNAEKHWIVLLFNDIIDPQFDWPLKYDVLIDFVDAK
jgi:nucleoid-associated protein YgaU